MSENKNDSKGKRVNCAENGLIAEQYTQNGWFVKIKPIFSLDKNNEFAYNRPTVLFSFVEKGKNGFGFDVYVDMDVFDLWADDVLDVSKTFKKTIETEAQAGEKYPVTYKYVTGSNGEKSVGFCKSTIKGAFATVNGCTVKDGKKVFANVPVDYNWLRICMKWYRRVTAPYFAMMAEVTRKNLVSEWYKPKKEDTEEFSSLMPQETNIEAAGSPQQAPREQKSENRPIENLKSENEANTKSDYQSIEVVTSTLIQSYGKKGNFCFKAFTKNNKELVFIVMPNEVDTNNVSVWEDFKKKAAVATNLKTTLRYISVNDKNLVKRFG